MNVYIISTEDPIKINKFLIKVIEAKRGNIVGLAIVDGGRLTIGKKRSKHEYILALLFIMGLYHFIKNGLTHVVFKLRRSLSKAFSKLKAGSLAEYARNQGIEVRFVKSPNDKIFINELRGLNIDVIINQSQSILKNELLSVPRICVINRHNALLPKNRGRITPFWVLYRNEKETGVSIHIVEEGIDSGDIIVQERYPVTENDTFNTLVEKNYKIAPDAMIKALDILESGNKDFIPNNDELATYNTTPSLQEAWSYRKKRLLRKIRF
jgi:methionyl-tRNA formyltransferase